MLKILVQVKNKTLGMTLVELMVALVISSIVLIGVSSFYFASFTGNKELLNTMRLDQELYLAMNIMENDIRRAGYWANASADIGTGALSNPFMQSGTYIQIGAGNDCILMSYDKNDDGSIPTLGDANDERFGFRLNNNIIQFRTSSSGFACTGSDTNWEDLTDPNVINVSNLSFTETVNNIALSGGDTLATREIVISLTANLVDDSTITRTLTRRVKVENSLFIPASGP